MRRLLAVVALAVAPACVVQPTVSVSAGNDPTCLPERLIILAQAVPSAQLIPCVGAYPAGWAFERMELHKDRAEFSLESDRAGDAAVTVTLLPECDTTDATEIRSDEEGARRFERIDQAVGRYVGDRFYVFGGGCVVYHFDLDVKSERQALANEVTSAVTFMDRAEVAAQVADYSDGELRLD